MPKDWKKKNADLERQRVFEIFRKKKIVQRRSAWNSLGGLFYDSTTVTWQHSTGMSERTMCVLCVLQVREKDSRCNNTGGCGRVSNRKGRPLGIAGYPLFHACPCQAAIPAHYRSLVQIRRTEDGQVGNGEPVLPFCSPSILGESPPSRSSDAGAPSSRRLWSSYHKIPVDKKIR